MKLSNSCIIYSIPNGGDAMNHNYLLNRVFSQRMMDELIKYGESELLNMTYAKLYSVPATDITNLSKIKKIYSTLGKKYRNEYFYKNTIVNKLLLGRHSIKTTTALTELSLNNSKADLILINGKAIVYEIKTELDSLARLDNQILDYYKVFDHVEVIIDEKHLNSLMNKYCNTTIGISVLTKKNTISVKKKPERNTKFLDYKSIYKVLRKEERVKVLNKFYSDLPVFDQFSEFEEMYKLFKKIDIESIYNQMIKQIKKRNKLEICEQDFENSPYELKSLLYFKTIKQLDYKILEKKMGEY